jgi:hypothetical protein
MPNSYTTTTTPSSPLPSSLTAELTHTAFPFLLPIIQPHNQAPTITTTVPTPPSHIFTLSYPPLHPSPIHNLDSPRLVYMPTKVQSWLHPSYFTEQMWTSTRRTCSIDMSARRAMCDEHICIERYRRPPDIQPRQMLECPIPILWCLRRAVDFQCPTMYAQCCEGVLEVGYGAQLSVGNGDCARQTSWFPATTILWRWGRLCSQSSCV